MFNQIGLPGIILIAVVVLILFGRGKISALMGEVGKGITSFKKGISEGNKMGFIVASDNSCCLDNITAFSEEWDKYKNLLYEGNTVLLRGSRDKNRGSFLIKRVEQLTS